MSIPYEIKVIQYLKKWREVAEQVKSIIKNFDPKAEVYVFGSVISGKYTGASDLDILIITNTIDKKYDIMVEVYKSIEAPIELHIITPQQFKKWYRKFIPNNQITKI